MRNKQSILDKKPINAREGPTKRWRCRKLPDGDSVMVLSGSRDAAQVIAATLFKCPCDEINVVYDATVLGKQ